MELNRSIEEYNTFAKSYEGSMQSITSKFYELERDRIRNIMSSVNSINVQQW